MGRSHCETTNTFDVKDAEVAGSNACFVLKGRLTEGQQYTIGVATGLFLDLAGNEILQSDAVSTFTVMSGLVSLASGGYSGASFPEIEVPVPSAADTEAPLFLSASPPVGVTDVPTSGVSALFFFSEPVTKSWFFWKS
jgi:hypothetical protein